jgi:hypothetical protein
MSLKIERVGKPMLLPGDAAYSSPSMQVETVYAIATTQLPGWPRGENWQKHFNNNSPFPEGLTAVHDGVNTITVRCDPGKCPDNWLDLVDAAIGQANDNDGTIRYAQ